LLIHHIIMFHTNALNYLVHVLDCILLLIFNIMVFQICNKIVK